ncbi:MAG: CDP-alcohol phosphatidyltransferase family protein [Spirochaetota bacterium]|jgi:CDP-diacylglycerol--serine O-phosphatidyltransferase|nr:CDP-alcohol phosphatidyltransferase family protein [Spirochaetota bacterium]
MSLTWIPNSFTLGNLFFGFVAMLAALRGRFDLASLFIFACMLLDMFDGRISRAIKGENPIGKELDSLADMLSFGVAPGVIFYAAFLGNNPIYSDIAPLVTGGDLLQLTEYNSTHILFGALAFLFPFAAALRLARFNLGGSDAAYSGCPSTTAGGLVVVLTCFSKIPHMFFMEDYNFEIPSVLLIILFVCIAFLMLVHIPFSKPQKSLFRKSSLSQPLFLVYNLMIIAALILFFKHFLLLVGIMYVIWSLVRGIQSAKASIQARK